VDARAAPPSFCADDVRVVPNFVSKKEARALMTEVQPALRKKPYEGDHWDSVISAYRETEKSSWTSASNRAVIARAHAWISECSFYDPPAGRPGPSEPFERGSLAFGREASLSRPLHFLPTHVLDLKKEGCIRPHVDSVKFSGGLVAGLSLLSPCTLRLRPVKKPAEPSDSGAAANAGTGARSVVPKEWADGAEDGGEFVDLLLPPRSMYFYQRALRYDWTHEILPAPFTEARGSPREGQRTGRRVSLLFRDVPADWRS
jgi:alkylated DNA repair protein alkB family protein 7